MSNKFRIVLIIIEIFVLAVLLLLGVGCQQKWIIITDDGPRFDWYAEQNDPTKPDKQSEKGELERPSDSETEETGETEASEAPGSNQSTPGTWQPQNPTVSPEETTEPESSEPDETTTAPTEDIPAYEEDEFPPLPID